MAEITETAQAVLEKRYFLKDKEGNLLESEWIEVCSRVAGEFAKDDAEDALFTRIMLDLDFLPNSPALMNAGTEIKAYSACYVLPIGDSIEEIYKFYADAALISKSGGGVGANYSCLRSAGSIVGSTSGVASGPLSFMRVQDVSTEEIKQGGKRRGANMGILDCDHEDTLDFIKAKDTPGTLENFNLSVRVSDEFMESVTADKVDPESISYKLWDELMQRAWSSAEPGILFGDTIERGNLVPHLGPLEATNPCGEQPLLPYENCCLGSINLSNHVEPSVTTGPGFNAMNVLTPQYKQCVVNWDKLRETVNTSVLFLNRILDASELPIPECQEAMEKTRKIGLGIMGLHDMLIQLDIPYDSEGGREVAGAVMAFINEAAGRASVTLGAEEGYYLALQRGESPRRRNAHLTTIAPTGTLSMIADCSSGCEPYFAPVTYKKVLDTEFAMPNKWVLEKAYDLDTTPAEVLAVDQAGSKVFKGAQDIHWRDHILMQAELQKSIDSSISKTINMPHDATVEDVKEVYELAWREGLKGITIYRDGSREEQVLSTEGAGVSDVERETEDSSGLAGDESHTEETPRTVPSTSSDESRTYEGPFKLDIPDEVDARRYRIRDHEGRKVYFVVCTYGGEVVEVFARAAEVEIDSYWITTCRMISLNLRYGVPLDDITKQLRKSSVSVGDTPSKLARILDKYKEGNLPKEDFDYEEAMQSFGNKCPDCGNPVKPEGGCFTCHVCGWSKCS